MQTDRENDKRKEIDENETKKNKRIMKNKSDKEGNGWNRVFNLKDETIEKSIGKGNIFIQQQVVFQFYVHL